MTHNQSLPVIVALDSKDIDYLADLMKRLKNANPIYKLGLEFFTAHGPAGIQHLRDETGGFEFFLDLKLHDIPNQVAGAIRSVVPLEPQFITVHASGGQTMMQAAAKMATETADQHQCRRPLLLAVSVLTSLDEADLEQLGQKGPVSGQVERLAALAVSSGIDGMVCSPKEIGLVRQKSEKLVIVTPGIRPASHQQGSDDQKRVMTPLQAIQAGADYLVIGRPITGADDPEQALWGIADEINAENTGQLAGNFV